MRVKVKVIEDQKLKETEIIIQCQKQNDEINDLLRNIQLTDLKIFGMINDRTYMIHPRDVYYFESVEEKIFCYTKEEVYETKYKLYELESLLESKQFIRVSRTMILNLHKIISFKSILSGRIECLLRNNEKVYISRRYVKDLKMKLGMKRREQK